MQQKMASGVAWVFGLMAAGVAALSGYGIVSVGTLGTLALYGLVFAVVAAIAVKKTAMSKGGIVGTFIACAVLGCIGFFLTTSSTLAAEVAAEVAKDPELNAGTAINEAAAGAAGGFAGALLTVGAFFFGFVGSLLGGLIPKK